MKKKCNIGLSSMSLWLYLDGKIDNPIRARSDAGGDVIFGDITKTEKDGKYDGEKFRCSPKNYLEFSEKHVVKIRKDWDEFSDESYYGKIKITESYNSI